MKGFHGQSRRESSAGKRESGKQQGSSIQTAEKLQTSKLSVRRGKTSLGKGWLALLWCLDVGIWNFAGSFCGSKTLAGNSWAAFHNTARQ
jgi:hypothetical protein